MSFVFSSKVVNTPLVVTGKEDVIVVSSSVFVGRRSNIGISQTGVWITVLKESLIGIHRPNRT